MWRQILAEAAIVALGTALLIGLTASIGVDRVEQPAVAGREAPALSLPAGK
jgi:hypothetical protein